MSSGTRCDEIIRLIDETLSEVARLSEPEPARVEAPEGTWGVYYLRPG